MINSIKLTEAEELSGVGEVTAERGEGDHITHTQSHTRLSLELIFVLITTSDIWTNVADSQ